MNYMEELINYTPQNTQEEADKKMIQEYIRIFPETILTRENRFAHMTASSMIFNRKRDKVLMVYHNIYQSWSWTGGHADGEQDMLLVAKKEVMEETGLKNFHVLGGDAGKSPLSAVDVLPVWGHMKRGAYVSSHLHLNFSYLFEAMEEDVLHIKADENSQVGWIAITELKEKVTEPDMIPIYEKLILFIQQLG